MALGWAAGYGIEKADCVELRKISDRFVSAEKSPETPAPLSGLLKDGVYLLTDASSHNKAVFLCIPPAEGGGNTLNTIFYSRNACSNLCIMQKLIYVAVISALLTTGTIWDIILLENIFRG